MDLFSAIEEPEREELKALRKELEEANYKYYVLNMPTLSDREFDEKMHRLQVGGAVSGYVRPEISYPACRIGFGEGTK